MFIKLHRINLNKDNSYYLSEVSLNVSHISYISENKDMKMALNEGSMNLDLHPSTTFTNVVVSNHRTVEKIVVVGSPDIIESKINKPYKQLLRG